MNSIFWFGLFGLGLVGVVFALIFGWKKYRESYPKTVRSLADLPRDIDDLDAEAEAPVVVPAEEEPLIENQRKVLWKFNLVGFSAWNYPAWLKKPWLWAIIAAPVLHLVFSTWLKLVPAILIWVIALAVIFSKPVVNKFKLMDLFHQAMADFHNPKKGFVWSLAYWGGWAAVWFGWLLVPVLVLLLSWVLVEVPILNRILEQAANSPLVVIMVSMVAQGLVLALYSWKLFPEGVLVREIVLKKTSRTLAGGKYRFYHPLATLRGYFSGEHTVDDERTDAIVRDSTNFDWIADMAIVIKFQDVTKLAGGEFERDLDSLKLSNPDDLTTFDPAKLEASQILKRAYVLVQNGAQIGAKKLTPDEIQEPDGKTKIAKAVNEAIAKDIYQKDSADNVLPDEQQPFIIVAQTNQITATTRTAQSLGLIAEVQTLKDKQMLDDEGAREYLLRKATGGKGGGSMIIENRKGGNRN